MKFGENLQAHLTPEWRSQYIDYELLKSMLYECREEAPDAEATVENVVQRYFAQFEERIFAVCDKELTKVNTFFAEKLAEANRRFAMLQAELKAQDDLKKASHSNFVKKHSVIFKRSQEKRQIRSVKELKLAFSEFYLSLVLLQKYQELNFTGFRKILKKHDKILETNKGCKWRQDYVETAPFYQDTHITQLVLKTEESYINDLEDGNRSKAMKRLRVPPLHEVETHPKWTVFRIGLFLGMFSVVVVVSILSAIILDVTIDPWITLKLYRPGVVLSIFIIFIGVDILGWRVSGVNHVLIFEIDPRSHLSHHHFFEIGSFTAILWALSLASFVVGNLSTIATLIPVYLNPAVLYTAYLLFLFNPLPIFFHKARFWLLKRLWRLLVCGYYKVEFADFWLADQLNSLVSLFVDIEFVVCFYSIESDIWTGSTVESGGVCGTYSYGVRALLACYPAFIRFVQCIRRYYDTRKWFPHIVNAGKYSTTFFKVTFTALFSLHYNKTNDVNSVYFYLMLGSFFINSCYTFAWDIKMDWGFLDKNAGDNKWLREEIVYPSKFYYYFGIVEDAIIRFAWVIAIGIEHSGVWPNSVHVMPTVFVLLEVFRRFVWNFFRLENEHLNNCGEFRAVRDISVAPLHEDDLTSLERMMDEFDGVEKQRKGTSKDFDDKAAKKLMKRNASSAMLYVGSGGSDEETSTSAV